MNRTQKEELVNELHGYLEKSGAVFVTDYKGLNVEQITQLRSSIKAAGGKYQVVKNTLLKKAAKGTFAEGVDPHLQGPTAIALALKDPVGVAKALIDFSKKNEKLEIQGGMLGRQSLSLGSIKDLALMPSRELMLGRVLGTLNAPISSFVGVMAAIPRQFLYALKAIEEQKSKTQA